MELQLAAVQSARSNGRNIPNYLKPSTGSCHHVCKYGGAHTFQEEDAHQPKPAARRQLPAASDQKKRLLPRKLFGDYRGRGGKAAAADNEKKKAAADKEKKAADGNVEWKDIVAYDTEPAHRSLPEGDDEISVHGTGSGHVKGKGVTTTARGKRAQDKAAGDSERTGGVKSRNESLDRKKLASNKPARSKMVATSKVSTTDKNMDTKPPRGRKATVLAAVKKTDQELAGGYRPLSPSLLQKRASLLRGLQEEAGRRSSEAANTSGFKAACCSVDREEDFAAAAAEISRPVPAHRRVKSVSSRSVRFPDFKLRSSRSSKAPAAILPSSEEEAPKPKPARLRSRRGSAGGADEVGGRVQLRIRSLHRRRGSGGASAGFVVPAVALRHQKTLERKRSQRLYNNVIQETATKLAKARRSRVKALVGAFESVISKIAK